MNNFSFATRERGARSESTICDERALLTPPSFLAPRFSVAAAFSSKSIDAVNKPTLPLPSGTLRPSQAKLFVSICLLLSTYTSLSSPVLFGTVALCNLIGTAYSLHPVRLKRR